MMKNVAAQLMLTALGTPFLFGDAPILNVSDQEIAVRMTIPVEEDLSDVDDYWTTIPEFLGNFRSISDTDLERLRTILNVGFPVQFDLRYQNEGLLYSLSFWIKNGEIVRTFVHTIVPGQAIGPDLSGIQEGIETVMDERLREMRKEADEQVEELKRKAAEEHRMIEEMESRTRENPEDSDRG